MKDLLFLAHRAPFAPDRGDRIRSFHVLRHLAPRARIHLVAFADDAGDLVPPPAVRDMLASCTVVPRTRSRARAAAQALATGRPVSLVAFADARVRAAVDAVTPDAAYCFSGQMAQYLRAPETSVMDFVDVDSAKFAHLPGNPALRALYAREARLLGAWERDVAERVAASVFVSEAEASLFRAGGGGGRVAAIGNGIDSAVFDPGAPVARPAGEGPLIVFTGQMDYRPNIDAVAWFADAVLPGIRRRYPGVRFAIVGRAPTRGVQALADRPGVVVTGAVDDVRGWLAAADVVVAPLLLARGIQNKVLEAMAMARAVVATPAAAEGIDHAGTLRIAGDAGAFAQAVTALLDDPTAAAALGRAARVRVREGYDWSARLRPLGALLGLAA